MDLSKHFINLTVTIANASEDLEKNKTMTTTADFTDEAETLAKLNDKEAENLTPVFVICGMLMIMGIFGNILVVYVYWRKMQDSAKRTFILSLAWLDLTVCAVVIPCEIYDLRYQVLFTQDALCKGMRFLEYATVLSAGFVLVSISFERYYFLCKAFDEFTPKKAKLVCVACVISAMLVAAPSAFFAGSKTRHFPGINSTGCECSMNSEHNVDELLKRFYYYFLAAIFLACVTIFIVLYFIIGRLLWEYHSGKIDPTNMERKWSKASNINTSIPNITVAVRNDITRDKNAVTTDHNSGQSHGAGSTKSFHFPLSFHGKRHLRSAGTVIVFFSVTVVFVVSFLPHLVMRIMTFFDYQLQFDHDTNTIVYNLTVRSYLLSNASNPFIYSIFNRAFRHELKRTLGRCRLFGNKSSEATLLRNFTKNQL